MATSYVVQSIRVPRDHHRLHGKGARGARTIAREYAKGDASRVGKADTTAAFYRFRLRSPALMRPGSYRTYTSPSGVEVVRAVPKARANPRATVCACQSVKLPKARGNPVRGVPWHRFALTMKPDDRHPERLPVRVAVESQHGGTWKEMRGSAMKLEYDATADAMRGVGASWSAEERRDMLEAARKAYRELYPDGHPNAAR